MPALVVCGNRTFVAGDDLRTFTFFAILLRVIQLIAVTGLTVLLSGQYGFQDTAPDTCDGSGGITTLIEASEILSLVYVVSSYVTAIVGLFIEVGIWRTSLKGTPTQVEKRACLQPLCHIKMIPMTVLRLANVAMGVMILKTIRQVCFCGGTAQDPYVLCPRLDELHAWLAILIGSHFAEGAIVGLTGIYFFLKTGNGMPSCFSAEAKWRCCCRCCCTVTSMLTCCLYGGRDGNTTDFADIAIILADFFDDGGTLDVVASDIVVGLRMLARVQNQKQSECRHELKRRVSFVAKQSRRNLNTAAMDLSQLEHDVESGLPEPEEMPPDISSDRKRLVHFDDEEETEEKVIKNTKESKASSEVIGETSTSDDNGVWTGRISLKDEEMGEVVVDASMSEEGPGGEEKPKDSALSGDLKMTEEVAVLLEEEEDDDEYQDVVLTRMGSEKKIRRRAVVYNLHHTGGFLHYKPAVREVLSRKNDEDKLAIAEGARFIRFACGVYFFRRYNAQRRSCEVCSALCEKGKECVNRCRSKANEMAGHDFLDLRVGHGHIIGNVLEARFLALANLDYTEIKYVQFGEGVARTPYAIAVDHAWKSIVIVIRGTEGLDDVVADLRMVPSSMEECGDKRGFDGTGFHVHAGMLACAEWIYDDLESHGIVDQLLSEPRHAGYTPRLTGHSLGAGTAAILSFMLKGKYPTLKCHCFCPPGCSVSENMSEVCKPYLTSYVLDHDIVPRMSLGSLENLRNDMLDMIARLKITKYAANHAKPGVDQDQLLYRQDSVPHSKFKEQFDEFLEQREEAISLRDIRSIPLYPPGKIVQLVKTAEDEPPPGCCCSSSSAVENQESPYAARWAHVEDFTEIIISSHFLEDHSSTNVLIELERTAEVFGLSAPFAPQGAPPARPSHRRASLWLHK